MKKLAGVLALLTAACFTAACGIQPSGVINGAAGPTESFNGPVLFLLNGQTLTRVSRGPTQDLPRDNLALLGAGPTAQERLEGLTTQVPAAAAPITMTTNNRLATVKISSPVAVLSTAARDQISCTAVPPWQEPRLRVVITGTDRSVQARACPFQS